MPAPQKVSADQIKAALARNAGNVTRAAAELGIARKNLYERMRAVDGAPAATGALRHRATRVTVEHFQALREAGFDLAFIERRIWAPEDVLRTFIAEAFPTWLASKLAELKASRGK
jgi:hypothetical protein